MATNKPNIGLGQARRLCQMSQPERLAFLAEGLPIILASAQGFWAASRELGGHAREAVVLAGLAREEAAKILILLDMVRCPLPVVALRIGDMVKWFYSHLARLIYADAVSWSTPDVALLCEYVDQNRRSHYLEGWVGEYIAPNWAIYQREGLLYGDVVAFEMAGTTWNDPADHIHDLSFPDRSPAALALVEAMSFLGMFTVRGLQLTADVWGQTEFKDKEGFREANGCTHALLEGLVGEGLPSNHAEQEHAESLYNDWPLPMYHLDFSSKPVDLQELKDERGRLLWQEMGGDCY